MIQFLVKTAVWIARAALEQRQAFSNLNTNFYSTFALQLSNFIENEMVGFVEHLFLIRPSIV